MNKQETIDALEEENAELRESADDRIKEENETLTADNEELQKQLDAAQAAGSGEAPEHATRQQTDARMKAVRQGNKKHPATAKDRQNRLRTIHGKEALAALRD